MAGGSEGESLVLVTGATGFIAGHCVKQLLVKGYRVRGTCRSVSSDRAAVLRGLAGASDRLELVEADLLAEGAFDEAVRGCRFVLHTASPFHFAATSAAELVEPAVRGTEAVLQAVAAHAPSVERVVLTSSFAAVMFAEGNRDHARAYTEEDWNDFSTPESEDPRHWYRASKAGAERAAWAFVEAKKPSFDLVTINPPLVIGDWLPGYSTLNTSSDLILRMADGRVEETARGGMAFVDVHDVALAHVRAMETKEAKGRFLVCGGTRSWAQIAATIEAEWPGKFKTPKSEAAGEDPNPLRIDASKATKQLGIEFIDVETSVRTQVRAFLREGVLKKEE